MAVPKKKTSKAKGRSRQAANWVLRRPAAQRVPPLPAGQGRHTWSARAAGGTRGVRPSRSTDLSQRAERPAPEALAALPGGASMPWAATRPRGRSSTGRAGVAAEDGIPVVLVGPPEQVGDTVGLDRSWPAPRSSPWTRTRPVGAPQEGLLAGAGGRAGARRQGLGHGQRRQHRGHHGRGPVAHGPAAGRGPPLHRHPLPAAGSHTGRPGRRRRQRRVHTGHAGPVRPDGRGLRRRPLRDRSHPPWRCCRSARSRPRARRWSRRPTRSAGAGPGRRRPGARSSSSATRGPRPAALTGRRHRDRRLHRQRRPQGPGGAPALPLRARDSGSSCSTTRPRRRPTCCCRTCSRWRPSSSRRTPVGPCCWGSTGSASSATALPTPRRWSTRCGWPTSAPPGVWRTRWQQPSVRRRRRKRPVQGGYPTGLDPKTGSMAAARESRPSSTQECLCLPKPTPTRARSTATGCSH